MLKYEDKIIMQTSVNKRIYYLDILRVIACLSVIMIHTSEKYVVRDFGTFNFYIGNLFDSIAHIGVPIFVMISGSLMLDEKYDYSNKKLIKHIVKLIVFFLFWSVLYSIAYNIIGKIFVTHEPIDILEFLKSIVKGHFHLWFIYMIVGLYLIVPLLRLWVKKENKKYIEYFMILSIIFSFILPQIVSFASNYNSLFEHINIIFDNINLKYVGGFTTYFILGWYLNNFDIKNKRIIYILGITGLVITFTATAILSITTKKSIQMYDELTINIFFQALMVFTIVKNKYKSLDNINNKLLLGISKNSLGIYAVHPLLLTITYMIFEKLNLNNAIINIPIAFAIVLFISYVIVYIMRKIPFLKNVV